MQRRKGPITRLKISRTELEWQEIDSKMDNRKFRFNLRSEIYKMGAQENGVGSLNSNHGITKDRHYCLDERSTTILRKLSTIMDRPMSHIVEEIIIPRILSNK